jgi:hypothetical protein
MADLEMRVAAAGDAQHARLVAMVEMFSAALAAFVGENDGDPNELGLAIAAASMFAGTLFGSLIVAGIAKDRDTRRVAKGVDRNFRTGIDVGKERALRVITENYEGSA